MARLLPEQLAVVHAHIDACRKSTTIVVVNVGICEVVLWRCRDGQAGFTLANPDQPEQYVERQCQWCQRQPSRPAVTCMLLAVDVSSCANFEGLAGPRREARLAGYQHRGGGRQTPYSDLPEHLDQVQQAGLTLGPNSDG
jgi:hypothetical protein